MKEDMYQCHLCDFYSPSLEVLLEHIAYNHRPIDEQEKIEEVNDGI